MSGKIKRGGTGARRQARAQGAKRRVKAARSSTGKFFDWLLRYLPFTEEQLQKGFLTAILCAAAGMVWMIASLAGFPALAQQRMADAAGQAGFQVERVQVRGVKRLNELKVYERVLGERDRAMPLVDIHALRDELLELSWVKDARVARQLPSTLVIDIVERTPHAVLRKPDRLVLIDETGHELETVSKAKAKGMLQVSGPGAQKQMGALAELLDAAPALKPHVTSAEWVGNRRWNLTFNTEQVLALPQGETEAASALMSFARLDGVNRLLGGKVTAFDMRAPDRIYMRIPGRAQQSLSTSAE